VRDFGQDQKLASFRASDVRLRVHKVTGRQVAELANGALEPGRHECVWQGRDRSGRTLEAGVYFVRVEARPLSSDRGLSKVQKIVLIK
jgi:flagellar hook assembly protein FlgD